MPQLTRAQVMQRWDATPDAIKEEIVSEVNADFIWRACESEHLPEPKRYGVLRIAGYVILGFLHPGDFAHELKEDLQLNPQVAETIAKVVNERIFNRLEDDLNKTYEPLSDLGPMPLPLSIDAIKKPSAPPPPPPAVSKIEPSPWTGAMKTPPPFDASQAKPLGPSIPTPPKPPAPSASSQISKESPKANDSIPPPPQAMSAPLPPKILQEEASFGKPLRQASGFSLNIPMPKSLDAKKDVAPMKPAMLELGIQLAATPPSPKAMEGAARVVHYTELRTPLEQVQGKLVEKNGTPATTPQSQASREVQEITAKPSSPSDSGGSTSNAPQPSLYGNSKFDRPATPPPPIPAPPSLPKMNDVLPRIPPKPPEIPPKPTP